MGSYFQKSQFPGIENASLVGIEGQNHERMLCFQFNLHYGNIVKKKSWLPQETAQVQQTVVGKIG